MWSGLTGKAVAPREGPANRQAKKHCVCDRFLYNALMKDTGTKPVRNGKPPGISRLRGAKLIVFGWYGGKFSHLDWLLPLLPMTAYYCFKALRDQSEKLQKAMALTPFSREEFARACRLEPDLPPLERARRFYVRARQVRTGLAQTASVGRWANCTNTIRAGMSGVVSRWL